MAGLLDDFSEFIKTPGGQGLLAATFGGLAGAQRGAPLNSLGRAGLAGLSGYGNALDRNQQTAEAAQMQKARDMQMQTQQMQLDAAKRQQEQQQALRTAAQNSMIAPTAATPDQPLNIQGDTGPNLFSASPSNMVGGGKPAMPAGFNHEGYIQALYKAGLPEEAIAHQAKIQKDNTITVAPGAAILDKRTFKPLYENPKEESTDPKIKQYEYALKNGYKDSFEKFVTLGPALMAAAAAPLRDAQVGNIVQENAYNLPPPRTAPAAQPRAPMKGQVVQGYRFKGGNPADQNNWEKK